MRREEERRLELHVPSLEELWYREKLLSDPETMAYNRGYDLDFEGYHRDTGCIDFPRDRWEGWYRFFIGQEPARWYAYLRRKSDGLFLGEVNLHQGGEAGRYEMGIVLEKSQRGRGCGAEGLELLLEQAFLTLNVPELHNAFEEKRKAALRIHLTAGFRETGREKGVVELALKREEYLRFREECFM